MKFDILYKINQSQMDFTNLSKETLIQIIHDQARVIEGYEASSRTNTIAPEDSIACKCRVWAGFPNQRCTRKATDNGYCKTHSDHRAKWGAWHLGEIRGPIPLYWGEFCEYVPCGRNKGSRIP
jgi:hypothetical protein